MESVIDLDPHLTIFRKTIISTYLNSAVLQYRKVEVTLKDIGKTVVILKGEKRLCKQHALSCFFEFLSYSYWVTFIIFFTDSSYTVYYELLLFCDFLKILFQICSLYIMSMCTKVYETLTYAY